MSDDNSFWWEEGLLSLKTEWQWISNGHVASHQSMPLRSAAGFKLKRWRGPCSLAGWERRRGARWHPPAAGQRWGPGVRGTAGRMDLFPVPSPSSRHDCHMCLQPPTIPLIWSLHMFYHHSTINRGDIEETWVLYANIIMPVWLGLLHTGLEWCEKATGGYILNWTEETGAVDLPVGAAEQPSIAIITWIIKVPHSTHTGYLSPMYPKTSI